jgi:hypothetical protein
MTMQNSDFYQAEQYLKLGLYPQAFEAFMALEVGSVECTFLKPCMMALDGQLNQPQLDTLFHELERETKNRNPQAVYNYGVVKSHFGDVPKATVLLQLAMDLGVAEARNALTRLLMKG